MYKSKDRNTKPLFEEFFPFGGQLDEKNRWLKISSLIPWEELEDSYASYFSDIGRRGLDGRLVVGLLLLKHMSGLGDEELVLSFYENPYWQHFCGFDHFVKGKVLDPSSLSRQRKRLGAKYFKELEDRTYHVLIERKILKAKGMQADGTVFPSSVKYPNDVGLLNDVREWLVGNVKKLGKEIGKSYRTYCRVAHKAYLGFSKKRKKTRKAIRRATKQMLQYVRRNIPQLKDAIEGVKAVGNEVKASIIEKLKVSEQIFKQQFEMYKNKTHRIKDRIVSFYRPYVRPIKRGKSGKDVEFGPKASLSHVDGFLFLDKLSHDNFSEADSGVVQSQIDGYERRFGKKPSSFTADKIYGNRGNRELLNRLGIRAAFSPLGRKKRVGGGGVDRWFKQKQKDRNRIEGHIGNGKEHYNLDRILYKGETGAEMWVRGGILGMNLKAALKRM